jgi:hypothetical protein
VRKDVLYEEQNGDVGGVMALVDELKKVIKRSKKYTVSYVAKAINVSNATLALMAK